MTGYAKQCAVCRIIAGVYVKLTVCHSERRALNSASAFPVIINPNKTQKRICGGLYELAL